MSFIKENYLIISFVLLLMPFDHTAEQLEVRFCGFEQSCSANITRQVLRNDACCRPCECDDLCAGKGTCCRDKKDLINTDLNIKQDCRSNVYTPDNVAIPEGILSYYTRTSCPKTVNDKNVKFKCENEKPETISDIIPVSSHDGKIIYKNKYCSYCHGERNYHTWEVTVHRGSPYNCRTILQHETLDVDTITRKLLLNCILLFTPPTNIDTGNLLCFDESTVMKKCNITGQWKMFDSAVNNFCLNHTDTGYYIVKSLVNIYNNLYCAICNGFSYLSIDSCWNTIERFPDNPMFTLLNVNQLLNQDISTRKPRRCGNGEIYDTYFKTCRTLYCLWNSIPYQGECVPFLDYANKLGYQLIVKLIPIQDMKLTEFAEADLRNHYIYTQRRLDFDNCGLCYVGYYSEKGSNESILQEMYVKFVFTPKRQCKIENIWSKFVALKTRFPMFLNLTVNGQLTVFQAIRVNDKNFVLNIWKIVFQFGSLQLCRPFSPTIGQICPKIKLLKHEVELVLKYHPRTNELTWVQNEEDVNKSSFVCLNNYITYQSSLSPMKYFPCYLYIFALYISMCFTSCMAVA